MRPTFIIAANLLLIHDGKVLLSKRANTGYLDGSYGCIGGHLEEAETLRQGVIREAKEEVGITIKPENLRPRVFMHHRSHDSRLQCFFVAEIWDSEPRICEPDKCSDLQWFAFDALPENTIPYVQKAIEEYQKGSSYCEFGW